MEKSQKNLKETGEGVHTMGEDWKRRKEKSLN